MLRYAVFSLAFTMDECGLYLTESIHQSVGGNLLQFHTQDVLEEYYQVILKSCSLEVFLAVRPWEHQVASWIQEFTQIINVIWLGQCDPVQYKHIHDLKT